MIHGSDLKPPLFFHSSLLTFLLSLCRNRVVSYLQDVQNDLRKKKQAPSSASDASGTSSFSSSEEKSDVILESIEAVHRDKAKEIATFICDGWPLSELNFLAKYRLQFHQQQLQQQFQLQQQRKPHILSQWNQYKDVEMKRSLLVEAVTADILETESMDQSQPQREQQQGQVQRQGEGGRELVIEMFNQRYGLKELEKEQKLKMDAANSYRYWLTFVISGLFFFCLLFLPRYLRSCAKFCSQSEDKGDGNNCSSLSSFCSVYFHFFSPLFIDSIPSSATASSASADGLFGDEFHQSF
jgi:hypothetical protein